VNVSGVKHAPLGGALVAILVPEVGRLGFDPPCVACATRARRGPVNRAARQRRYQAHGAAHHRRCQPTGEVLAWLATPTFFCGLPILVDCFKLRAFRILPCRSTRIGSSFNLHFTFPDTLYFRVFQVPY